jgi:hypothetical protein
MRRHGIALLVFAAITGLWLHPLLSQFSTALPGTGAGDNVTFAWNIWWMRYVLHHPGSSFFWTTMILYPFGADLTLHTHTALPALVAAVAGPSSIIAAQNVLIVLHIYLNFACSYALGYTVTGRVVPAMIGATIFGTSTFVGAHLLGHFNLIAAWIVPLVVLLMAGALERASTGRGIAAGIAAGAAAYIDYYLFVYTVVLLLLHGVMRAATVSMRAPAPSRVRRRSLQAVIGLLIVDVVVIAAIAIWPGDRVDIGPVHLSVRSVSNPVTFAWLLAGIGAAVVGWSRLRVRWRVAPLPERVPIAAALTATVILLPLIVGAARLWSGGRYVSQAYQWRSAPGGIDVATFLLGNPFHAVWGDQVRRAYTALRIDVVEGSGWIPAAALILVALAVVLRRQDRGVQRWSVCGVLFMIWALGPWLIAFGRQSPLMLPALAVRFVPVVANARIPGRAMVVVFLCVAMLAAVGAAWLIASVRRGPLMVGGIATLLAVECAPASPPLFAPQTNGAYQMLKASARSGAVCELPMGLRDGFGELGRFDSTVLLHQTVHERPVVGGFLARLPPGIGREYNAMPIVGAFLRLSSGGSLSDESVTTPAAARSALAAAHIGFVVLDSRTAPMDLIRYVQSLALTVIAEQDGRIFYEVD